jgi:hypothetical protein
MIISKNGAEIRSVDEWFTHAKPKKGIDQWKDGRSAKECARAWCPQTGDPCVPRELVMLLDSHADMQGAAVHSVTPEQPVRFDRLRGEPRNADIVMLAQSALGSIAISVEAKADEPFDLPVRDILNGAVRKIAMDERTEIVTRIQSLARSLLPPPTDATKPLGDLRYQLLTGVAGAIAFATQVKAPRAVFLVHEFISDETTAENMARNASDLDAFVARLTGGRVLSLSVGKLEGPLLQTSGAPLFRPSVASPAPTPALYIGKAQRDLRSVVE